MNDNEIQRIAAAINMARPQWPTKQLLTLLHDPRMSSRPRRDAFVALAWIASESETQTPYRVLEAGPWWHAAGVTATNSERRTLPPDQQCAECGHSEATCRRRLAEAGEDWGHTFWPISKGQRGSDVSAERMAELIQQARRELEASLPPVQTSWMERRPAKEKCGEDGCTRGNEHTGPHWAAATNDDDGGKAA